METSIVEVQSTNRTTSTVLPVQENLTPSADFTETVSTDPPNVPDFTQEIFTNPPNVDTPWVASTPPSPLGLTQYWTPETSPRDSQFSPSQTFFSPFE